MSATRGAESTEDELAIACGGCGHLLRGASGRCPECGRAFDPNRLTDQLIPWEQRRQAGYVRAYVRTAYLATFRPWLIARKADSPVSYTSARSFRRITLLVAFLPLLIIALIVRSSESGPPWRLRTGSPQAEMAQLLENPWSFSIAMVGIFLGLYGTTVVTSAFFFRRGLPSELRGRAVAIGCYAAAPLTMIPFLVGLGTVTTTATSLICRRPPTYWVFLSEIMSSPWVLPVFVALVYIASIYSAVVMMRVTARCTVRRAIAAAIVLPVLWTCVMIVVPAFCEFLLAFGYLVFRSLS